MIDDLTRTGAEVYDAYTRIELNPDLIPSCHLVVVKDLASVKIAVVMCTQ